MRGQMRQIEARLRRVRQQLGQERLRHLPEALRQHAATGQVPVDPLAAAYVRLNASAIEAMNASVAESDHEAACERYQHALSGWRQALKGGAK